MGYLQTNEPQLCHKQECKSVLSHKKDLILMHILSVLSVNAYWMYTKSKFLKHILILSKTRQNKDKHPENEVALQSTNPPQCKILPILLNM